MRTRTSPGPGSGSGASRTERTSDGSPNFSKTIARITSAFYRRVLAINPDNSVAVNNLAIVLNRLGRSAEAESLVVPAARAFGTTGNMYLQLLAAQVGQDASHPAPTLTEGRTAGKLSGA